MSVRFPVARALWECKPDFKTACIAWILAGGAHHTGYSYAVTTEHTKDFADIAGVELVVIDEHTSLRELKNQLRQNDLYYAPLRAFVAKGHEPLAKLTFLGYNRRAYRGTPKARRS